MIDFDTPPAGSLLVSLTDMELKRSISELNDRFTAGRHRLAGYGDDPQLVSAYAAFYLPTNMRKLPFVLSQLSGFPLALDGPTEIIDFGCGPGTYGFAIYAWLCNRYDTAICSQISFHFVDTAPLMLQQAKKIQQTLYPRMNAAFSESLPSRQPNVQRIVLFGNVVNETGVSAFNGLLDTMNPDAMIFIEPGTLESFRLMIEVRARLLARGYQILYPCATGAICPVEKMADEWCHQVLKASLSPSVARMGQLAALDRTVMPFIGHVYSKHRNIKTFGAKTLDALNGTPSVNGILFRLKTHSKHAFFWEVCLKNDSGLELVRVELPKKAYSKNEQKAFTRISAGQRISFDVQKILGDGTWRIENVKIKVS